MKLYSMNFHTIPVRKGEIEVVQSSGVVSQRFRVKIESVDCDPV
ncbi:MAG: hypothetical protein JWP25_336 [Bradyrhizobium sp.]|nr:hypothetical protein [Bradyrhizobium sp.]